MSESEVRRGGRGLPCAVRSTLREKIRDNQGAIRFRLDVKFRPPPVTEARPRHCVVCGVGAYEGERLRIYGHGLVSRQQRGPPGPGEPAACAEVLSAKVMHLDATGLPGAR